MNSTSDALTGFCLRCGDREQLHLFFVAGIPICGSCIEGQSAEEKLSPVNSIWHKPNLLVLGLSVLIGLVFFALVYSPLIPPVISLTVGSGLAIVLALFLIAIVLQQPKFRTKAIANIQRRFDKAGQLSQLGLTLEYASISFARDLELGSEYRSFIGLLVYSESGFCLLGENGDLFGIPLSSVTTVCQEFRAFGSAREELFTSFRLNGHPYYDDKLVCVSLLTKTKRSESERSTTQFANFFSKQITEGNS